MKKMKSFSLKVFTTATLFSLILPSILVNADEITLNKNSEQQEFIKRIQSSDTSESVKKRLITKVVNGIPLDSTTENGEIKSIENTSIDQVNFQRTTYEDGSFKVDSIDFSDSSVLDIDNKDVKSELFEESPIKTRNSSITGGKWSSGTGYKAVKGAKVGSWTMLASLYFKADFETVSSSTGKSQINRIYGVDVSGKGSVSILNQGLFRKKATETYSAYGGVKVLVTDTHTNTKYSYLRVKGSSYWVDTSL